MFDGIPVQVWLLILIGLFAWPAWLVARNRIMKPDIDHSRPSLRQGALAFAALSVAGASAIFIFTPQAKIFAHSPQFLPLLMIPLVGFAIYMTILGYLTGSVEPLSRGSLGPYSRIEQPRRYWASQIWNVTLSVLMVWLLFKI